MPCRCLRHTRGSLCLPPAWRSSKTVAMRNRNMVAALLLSSGSAALCVADPIAAQDAEMVTIAPQEAAPETEVASPESGRPAPERLPAVTREDALLAARACAHESTFAGGRGGTFDCGAQVQVIQTRRHEHETFSHALLRTMPRFAAHSTSRSWVHYLPDGPIRGEVHGWPYPYPARHDSDRWHSVFLRVSDFMLGREGLPCEAPPEQWFGRETDSEALQGRLATGRWVETDCNPGGRPETQTLNAYLARVPRHTPDSHSASL